MGALFVGLILGAVVSSPIVFLLTAIGAARVWRCVPCVQGALVSTDIKRNARVVDEYTRRSGV